MVWTACHERDPVLAFESWGESTRDILQMIKMHHPPPSRLYLPQLDVMRFFAFLCVFLFHGLPANDMARHTGTARLIALFESTVRRSGETGVALFFLLSAYLITEILRREKLKTGRVHVKMFYIRRILRIWPLYYLAICIGVLLPYALPASRLGSVDLITFILFVKNWDIMLRGGARNPIFVLWTVSMEEQFYFVWPVAQSLLSRSRLILLCAILIVVIPLIAFFPGGFFVTHHATNFAFLFVYFPIGGLFSELLAQHFQRTPLTLISFSGLLAVGAALWVGGTLIAFPGGAAEGALSSLVCGRCLVAIGTVVIFLAFLWGEPGWFPTWLVYLGKISYGLYVFHVMMLQPIWLWLEPIFLKRLLGAPLGSPQTVLVHLGLSLLLTIAAAVLSYEFFERRFLQLKDRFAVIHSRAA
jgi:peptidoglycan/LPS O-acetylase OafA/YrhL